MTLRWQKRWSPCLIGACLTLGVARVAAAQACTGDCSNDGAVTVNELVLMVNVALSTQPVSACMAGDRNGDGEITITEIIAAVNYALDSCPGVTPSPTPTPTPAGGPTECPTLPSGASGSIVVWPELRVDAGHDPLVRLTNRSRSFVAAYCFYANASPRCAGSGAPCSDSADCGGDTCESTCGVAGFTVRLPMLSTLAWQPRLGGVDELDSPIPTVPSVPFDGELVCVQVDEGGYPVAGNGLAGSREQPSQCPAVVTSVAGFDTGNGDPVLCLDGGPSDQCPYGTEYEACPSGVDPIRVEGCWSKSAFTFDCGPSVTAPTPTPTRTPPAGSTPTPTACPQALPGSVVVFEDLRVSATEDPVLELRNVGNSQVNAHCFYAAAGAGAGCTGSEFSVSLARQASLTWHPRVGGADKFGNVVPAIATLPFDGELVCVEVFDDAIPIPGNRLSGAVTSAAPCSAVATAIRGNPELAGDDQVLCLGGNVSAQCPSGAEYDSCPATPDPARIEGCWSQSRFDFVCG